MIKIVKGSIVSGLLLLSFSACSNLDIEDSLNTDGNSTDANTEFYVMFHDNVLLGSALKGGYVRDNNSAIVGYVDENYYVGFLDTPIDCDNRKYISAENLGRCKMDDSGEECVLGFIESNWREPLSSDTNITSGRALLPSIVLLCDELNDELKK